MHFSKNLTNSSACHGSWVFFVLPLEKEGDLDWDLRKQKGCLGRWLTQKGEVNIDEKAERIVPSC